MKTRIKPNAAIEHANSIKGKWKAKEMRRIVGELPRVWADRDYEEGTECDVEEAQKLTPMKHYLHGSEDVHRWLVHILYGSKN